MLRPGSMGKWKTALLLMVAAGLSVPQTATENLNADVRRVGERLACKCGSCNNTVGDCPMLGCGYASPARAKIAGMQSSGMGDDQIVNSFVKEMGLVALAVPPAEGFNLLSWTMPFVVLLLGFGAILIYWKRFRKPVEATAAKPQIDERYRSRIEREMADLD